MNGGGRHPEGVRRKQKRKRGKNLPKERTKKRSLRHLLWKWWERQKRTEEFRGKKKVVGGKLREGASKGRGMKKRAEWSSRGAKGGGKKKKMKGGTSVEGGLAKEKKKKLFFLSEDGEKIKGKRGSKAVKEKKV